MDPDPSKRYFSIIPLAVIWLVVDPSMIWGTLILLLFLLFMSALISGSEVAFFSLSPQDFHDLDLEGSPAAKRILKLRDTPRTLLATILISNNLINIAIVIVSDYFLRGVVSDDVYQHWGSVVYYNWHWTIMEISTWGSVFDFLFTIFLITFILVLFGEITPKIYANIHSIRLAKRVSGLLVILNQIFGPFSKILVRTSNIFENKFRQSNSSSSMASKEEIDRAIELTVLHEVNAETEKNMLKSIVKFGDVSVKQIMKARVDIIAIDFKSDFKYVMDIIKDSGYSRIPVYKNDLDNIVGLLYVKDLLGNFNAPEDFEWQPLLRTNVLYVPEAKKIDEVLNEFRKERVHMALIVDEYGGTSGLVTLEDILEEVIGDIKDEFDDENEIAYEQIDENTYVFDGKTMINDLCRVLNIDKEMLDLVRGDADSIAGLILEMFGQIPRKNTEIKYNQFIFKVVSVSKRRIEKIQISISK